MVRVRQKRTPLDLIFLTGLAAFFFLYKLGSGSLASWDEAIYASVAREMYLSGDWFHLTLGGEPWVDKPPLTIWATAFFYRLFGMNEMSARLFSSLCGVGTVVVTYLFGKRLLGAWPGLLGALVLMSSSHFIRFSRFGMTDAPLTFFMTLSLYFFWMGEERNRYYLLSGVALGLALMAKGAAAFLVFPVVWLYCLWARELEITGKSSYWIGLMIAAAIALPWNLYELMANRQEFVDEVVKKHLWLRVTQPLEGHVGTYYFYIRTLINKYHPWILIGVVSGPYFLFKAIKDGERPFIFITVWMFSIFLIITLVQTKLPWYVMPLYPPLSLTVGWVLSRMIGEEKYFVVHALFAAAMVLHVPYSHIWNHDYSRDIKGIAPAVVARVPADARVTLYEYHETPACHFYLGRNTLWVDDPATLLERARKPEALYLLIHEDKAAGLESKLRDTGLTNVAQFERLRFLVKPAARKSV